MRGGDSTIPVRIFADSLCPPAHHTPTRMSDRILPPPLTLPQRVIDLLESTAQWSSSRWSNALDCAGALSRRDQRTTSRALCDAVLAHEERALHAWMVRDAVRTTLALRLPSSVRQHARLASELLEDAGMAALARPALPLLDFAVLVRPCLPFVAR